jgi:hypothetical protein
LAKFHVVKRQPYKALAGGDSVHREPHGDRDESHSPFDFPFYFWQLDPHAWTAASALSILARAATHFTILKLAKEGALENDPKRFEPYVYPAQLDEVLNLDMARLKRRSQTLQSRPSERHGLLEALVIPPALALAAWADPPRR